MVTECERLGFLQGNRFFEGDCHFGPVKRPHHIAPAKRDSATYCGAAGVESKAIAGYYVRTALFLGQQGDVRSEAGVGADRARSRKHVAPLNRIRCYATQQYPHVHARTGLVDTYVTCVDVRHTGSRATPQTDDLHLVTLAYPPTLDPAREHDHPALLQAKDVLDGHQEWLLHRIHH